ncbi:MAG: hypothetical protein L6Q99_21635 [Planctomycetes bacterium]|nr:hypothetical protein [Planctomycetota bacterium]
MKCSGIASFVLVLGACAAPSVTDHAREAPPAASDAERVVQELYDLVCVPPGGPLQDWARVRELFLPEAVVVLRDTRTSFATFSLEGWIADFVAFDEKARVVESGFTERVVEMHTLEYGDVAQSWVLYEAALTGSPRPPTFGVDGIQLVKRDGAWRIAAIVNELVPRGAEPSLPAAALTR